MQMKPLFRIATHFVCFALICCAVMLFNRPAYSVIYGPDLTDTPLSTNITDQYYVLSPAQPDPMNVFDWQDADYWNGGFTTGINSAQPVPANQTFMSLNYPLGFWFTLFGNSFDTVQVSLYGWVSFSSNVPIHSPTDSAPQPKHITMHPQRFVIAPYWAPFYQTLQYGAVFCKYVFLDGLNAFIIQWHDLQIVSGNLDTSAFFQLILFADGRFKFQYYSMGTHCNGSNASIGFRIDDKYLQYSYLTTSISDGFALEFTPTLTPPPFIQRTLAITDPKPVYPTSIQDVSVFQFFIEPRLNQGTIEYIKMQVEGTRGTNIPPQTMYLYIVRDVNANGVIDANDPVVSGLNGDGTPFLWDPWQGGDSAPVGLYDSPLTQDGDNTVVRGEGRKYYIVVARFANLIMGDNYAFNIVGLIAADLGISPQFPIFVAGGGIKIELANFPMIYSSNFNPPLQYFDTEPDTHGVAVMSFAVKPAQDFSSRLRSLMVVRTGSAPGGEVRLRFFLDRATRGVFEPGVDIELTASALDSNIPSALGYTLGTGEVGPVIDIPILAPPAGTPDSESKAYLPANGESINILAVCDFDLGAGDDGKLFSLKLVGMNYIGEGPGLVNLTKWGLQGSVVTILVARSVLKMNNAPNWNPEAIGYVAQGSKEALLAYFAAYPSNRSGRLEGFTVKFSGSGNDATELSNVKIYADLNANGFVDGEDWLLFTGKVPADNGYITTTLPAQLGAFVAWRGGSTADFADLNRFLVLAEVAATATLDRDFRISCTSFTFSLSGESLTLQESWIAPRFVVKASTNPYLASQRTELEGLTIHVLKGSTTNAAVFRLYCGASDVSILGIGLQLPTGAWDLLSHMSVYRDDNRDRIPQAEEILYSFNAPSLPPVPYGAFFVPTGAVSIKSGATTDIAVYAAFSGKPQDSDTIAFELTKIYFSSAQSYGQVHLSPFNASTTGAVIKIVDSAADGGSLGVSRNSAISVGTPTFVSSGEISLNFSNVLCSPVETIRIDRLEYSYSGDIVPNGQYVEAVRMVLDDGDGRYAPGTDRLIDGTFSFDIVNKRIRFTPTELYTYPSNTIRLLLTAYFKTGIPKGSFLRVDLEPSSIITKGIVYDQLGIPSLRIAGASPAVYGSKVQGATLYFGVPTIGDDDDDDDDPPPAAGGGGGGGGCFIASAAFGSVCCNLVLDLCYMRDEYLCSTSCGSSISNLYFATSPAIANRISEPYDYALRLLTNKLLLQLDER